MTDDQRFHYVIGHYWESGKDGQIKTFMTHDQCVNWGTREQAERTLKYARNVSNERPWKIFIVTELE